MSQFYSPQNTISKRKTNASHRPRRSESFINKDCLVKKQFENQIAFEENSLKVLKSIYENQECNNKFIEEIRQDICDIKRYSKRKCDIEEHKLKLAKEKFEFKKKIELEKCKKMAQLELKQKIFDVEYSKK